MSLDLGTYKIKCVCQGGYILNGYGQYIFKEGEEIDLMDQSLPETIRCSNWSTADSICKDVGFEIAQLIIAGNFIITEKRPPNIFNLGD